MSSHNIVGRAIIIIPIKMTSDQKRFGQMKLCTAMLAINPIENNDAANAVNKKLLGKRWHIFSMDY